jgi:serine/threonine protein kinase
MALSAGTQLGSFEITGQIGVGGMGEVYRATDTKLGRDVAIKTLPAALAEDKDRIARFEREAKLLASLQHAHIASVFSLDEHDGSLYIAMELVVGETLEETLKRGALPVENALQLGLQIALALEAAHEKGVVHRDLKPANIMITPDGIVKVLDFGLAKAFSGDPNEATAAHSPALSLAMTQQGLILGTAGYMSPEQASGQATDQRADVWAFGVVLYEMLTGQPVFSGESVPHILAAVLQLEPDWGRLPKNLHWRVRQTLARCLRKRPRDRYHSIADVRVDIEDSLHDPDSVLVGPVPRTGTTPSPRNELTIRAGMLAAGMALVTLTAWYLWPSPEPELVDRFVHVIPDEQLVNVGTNALDVSPDGRTIVYGTLEGLYRRTMDQLEPQLIPGSRRSDGPINHVFFSRDGQSVAFISIGTSSEELMRIPVTGGRAEPIAAIEDAFLGGSWGADGTILYATEGGIYSVPATGGAPPQLVVTAEGELYRRPQLLPDGDSILVSLTSGVGLGSTSAIDDATEFIVLSLATGERRKTLFGGGGEAEYVATGHIVYVRGGELYGVAFDVDTLTVSDDHVPLEQGVSRGIPILGAFNARFAVADEGGTTAYFQSGARVSRATLPVPLVWVDQDGNESLIEATVGRSIQGAAVSPDGARLVIAEWILGAAESDQVSRLWLADVARPAVLDPVLGHTDLIHNPRWIDNERVIVSLVRGENLAWMRVDGAGGLERLSIPNADAALAVSGLTPDRSELIVTYGDPRRIGLLPVEPNADGEHPIEPLIEREADVWHGQVAPQGDLIIYESSESEQSAVYIENYPERGRRQTISGAAGGSNAIWSEDGNAVFYRRNSDAAVMKVTIQRLPALEVGEPETLFEDRGYRVGLTAAGLGIWNLDPDGRFLMFKQPATAADRADDAGAVARDGGKIIVVQGFAEELRRLVPTN